MRKPRVETKPRKTRLTCENAYLLDSYDWLKEQYVDKNLSLKNISKVIPCSTLTVRRKLKRYGIEIKPKHIYYSNPTYPPRSGENSSTWKGGLPKCNDCTNLVSAKSRKRCITCHLLFNRGENHPSWKPPEQRVGTETEIIRNSSEYKEWRIKVWARDKTKCKVCGIRKDLMVAHHLDGFNIFPEKRFDVNNGVTLCDKHHISFHTNYGFGNNTKEQFEEYLNQTTEVTY